MVVFVSYQRADTAFAARLGYALRAGGHDAFFDTGSIDAGEPFRQAIANAVSRSNLVLALIGPGFDAARLHEPASVVAYEWQRARFHGIASSVLVDGGAVPTDEHRGAALVHAPQRRRPAPGVSAPTSTRAWPPFRRWPPLLAVPRVLWVDDRPATTSTSASSAPARHRVRQLVSTDEAVEQLRTRPTTS
jgi:hypothetical protein